MKLFLDSAGREWTLAITLGAIKRVFDRLGIDLLNPDQGDPPLLTRLHTSPVLLVDLLYVLAQPEAESRGVTSEQFGASLNGHAAYAAYAALMEDWTDFFLQLHRRDLAEGLTAHRELVANQAERTAETIGPARAAIEDRLQRKREKLLARLTEPLGDGPGRPSGSLPASPAATPGA